MRLAPKRVMNHVPFVGLISAEARFFLAIQTSAGDASAVPSFTPANCPRCHRQGTLHSRLLPSHVGKKMRDLLAAVYPRPPRISHQRLNGADSGVMSLETVALRAVVSILPEW